MRIWDESPRSPTQNQAGFRTFGFEPSFVCTERESIKVRGSRPDSIREQHAKREEVAVVTNAGSRDPVERPNQFG
jgi:hypothetical protein